MMSFIEKLKWLLQTKTVWVILVHLFVIFPIFAKVMYDSYYLEKTEKKERFGWIDLGIWMLIIGVVYHVYILFEYSVL